MSKVKIRLVKRAIRGNQQAFADLMLSQAEYLTQIGHLYLHREVDIQDAIGETTLIALHAIQGLKKPELFRTWVTKILIRQCYKRYKEQAHEQPENFELPEVPESLERATVDEKLDLLGGLKRLNDRYRQVLLLFYYQGLSIREISDLTSLPENTVKSHLKRGKAELKQWLGGDYFEK
ncbi:sigma-70 family RNA polymerase sigma factor [Pediococcus siamensis]|uniref:sigma-70 family RNA polymerase sigma factor n=1 Tax=Pediococcus siamensis TaxID=381829 RepID=UPI0039A3C845